MNQAHRGPAAFCQPCLRVVAQIYPSLFFLSLPSCCSWVTNAVVCWPSPCSWVTNAVVCWPSPCFWCPSLPPCHVSLLDTSLPDCNFSLFLPSSQKPSWFPWLSASSDLLGALHVQAPTCLAGFISQEAPLNTWPLAT